MDLHMPQADGITATGAITAELPGVRVLALSTFDLDEYVVDALRAGALGFLPKDISPEELVEGVRVVHRGEAAVAPRSADPPDRQRSSGRPGRAIRRRPSS